MSEKAIKKSRSEKREEQAQGALDPNDVRNYDLVAPSLFRRAVVLEVINDPNRDIKDQEKVNKWKSQVSNGDYAEFLPRNSIIAKLIGEQRDPMFMFPFFPSHLSLPCKPGESIWAFFEKTDSNSNIAFWMSRVIDGHQTDDVNHSHPGNIYEVDRKDSIKEVFEKTIKKREQSEDEEEEIDEEETEDPDAVWSELRNGPVLTVENDRFTRGESSLLPGEPEDVFERLITETDAASLMEYEPVPRFTKRPGDVVLEGTNNTLIVLGKDRNGPPEKTKFSKESGTIDIVSGRGQTPDTFGKQKSVTSIFGAKGDQKGPVLKKELDKSIDNLKDTEGDPSYESDRSRVLISQRTSPDNYFKINSYNSSLSVQDSSSGDAAIVIKSDKIRLIARSDVQILVTGFSEEKSPAGSDIKKESTDSSNWGSITINSKGEIIIKPGNDAVIKLGGEEANKAILCAPSLYPGTGGIVTATPISTTMGGQIGLPSPGLGEWASKVLIK